MRYTTLRAAIALAATSAALASAAPAGADQGVHHASGGLQLTPPTVVWTKTIGNTTVTEQTGTAYLSGDINGSGTLTIVETVTPDGSAYDVGRFDGQVSVGGKSGTLNLYIAGTDDGTAASGTLVAHGSDGLNRLNGAGSFTDSDTTGAGSYSLTY